MGIKRMGTFITVPREIFDDGLFVHEPYSRREAFLDLVQKAVHEETVLPVRGGSITLNRGEVFASIRYLATRWGWSKSKVEAVLKEFISMNLVGHKSDTSNSTLSIVNYDLYQRPVDTCKDENGDTCKDADRDKINKDKEPKELKEKSSNEDTKKSLPQSDAGTSAQNAEPSNRKEIKYKKQVYTDEVERIYKLYPTVCPTKGRVIKKGDMCKKQIVELLKTYSAEELERLITNYVAACKTQGLWMQDFLTFLHQRPEYEMPDTPPQGQLFPQAQPTANPKPQDNVTIRPDGTKEIKAANGFTITGR